MRRDKNYRLYYIIKNRGEFYYCFRYNDSDYLVIGVKAVAGYSYDFTEKLFAEADLGVGLDNRRIGSHKQNSFAADLYLGCGYRLSDEFAVTGGVDLGLGLQKGKYSRSTDFEAETRVGLLMAL